jgi:hypothetical protein
MSTDDTKPITVEELRQLLERYPATMPVVFRQYSEYVALTAGDIIAAEMFDNGGYWSKPYRDKDKPLARMVLVFPGN